MVDKELTQIIESLSPNERKVVHHLDKKDLDEIEDATELNKAAILRSLEFLSNKGLVDLKLTSTKVVELGVNGVLYKKKGLPERRLINLVKTKKSIALKDAKKQSGLTDNEFKAALGALKKKALLDLKNGKLIIQGNISEISKHSLEETLIQSLPIQFDKLEPEQKFAVDALKNRKDIIEINTKSSHEFTPTDLGKKLMDADLSAGDNMIEALTPEIIKGKSWKTKKFRRYDVQSPVPKIYGGKRHFVNQATDYARKIWTDLGFEEMTGNMVVSGFWNFDALFTAQDHPVREMQDTFYLKNLEANLPDKELVEKIKKSHESGTSGSKGWGYKWKEQDSKKVLLRTHTTCLSSQTLAKLKNLKTEQKKGKYFAIGKCFRNETVDWSHGFEFNQSEGIVIDPNANFRHLLGYLKEFFNKMGFEKIKFVPAYFPYTEPSVEIHAWHPERKIWLEIGGAGIFRPEVTIPLLGEWIPVLAWGPGFDRTLMDYYKIKDLRELYENNITKLRQKKSWMKN
jgi:phenylalanyl-tRNA synthetase alpha chain